MMTRKRLYLLAFAATATVALACTGVFDRPAAPPLRPEPSAWPQSGVTIAYLGHASVLLRFGRTNILTDPAFFDRIGVQVGPLTLGPKRLVRSALAPEELPPLDAVLVSHAHMDSLDRPSLARVNAAGLLVVPRRTSDLVDDLGFSEVRELHWRERLEVGDVVVEAVELAHWGKRWPWEAWRGYNGYLITGNGASVLFASDTAYTPVLGEYGRRRGIDVAILGNGAYDPWIRSHADPEQVWRMFEEMRASYLFPIHWDTFRLGKEPVGDAMARLDAAAGNDTERIVIRRIGETWRLPPPGSRPAS